MRAALSAALFASFCGFAAPSAAAPCVPGEEVRLTGEIIIPPVIDGDEWFLPGDFTKPCDVRTIRGKGKLPAECVVGKRMTVSGRVVRDGVLILEAAHIHCFEQW